MSLTAIRAEVCRQRQRRYWREVISWQNGGRTSQLVRGMRRLKQVGVDSLRRVALRHAAVLHCGCPCAFAGLHRCRLRLLGLLPFDRQVEIDDATLHAGQLPPQVCQPRLPLRLCLCLCISVLPQRKPLCCLACAVCALHSA